MLCIIRLCIVFILIYPVTIIGTDTFSPAEDGETVCVYPLFRVYPLFFLVSTHFFSNAQPRLSGPPGTQTACPAFSIFIIGSAY